MSLNDPALQSFLPIAADHPFPIQNLPLGVFRHDAQSSRIGVAIGDYVLDLATLTEDGLLPAEWCTAANELNRLLAAGRPVWQAVRERVSLLLRHDNPTLRDDAGLRARTLIPRDQVEMLLPA